MATDNSKQDLTTTGVKSMYDSNMCLQFAVNTNNCNNKTDWHKFYVR